VVIGRLLLALKMCLHVYDTHAVNTYTRRPFMERDVNAARNIRDEGRRVAGQYQPSPAAATSGRKTRLWTAYTPPA
jgi:hypothetical protein